MYPSGKQISNQTHFKYFEDGIWDIVIGVIFLLVGVSGWYDMNILSLAPLILLISPPLIKSKVTLPRTGHIQLRKQRKIIVGLLIYGSIALVEIGILILGILNPSSAGWVQFFTQNLVLLSGIVIGSAMILTAWYMNYQRLYGFAFLTIIVFAIMRWWGHLAGISLTLSGLVILLIGLLILNRFINSHPVLTDQLNPSFSREEMK